MTKPKRARLVKDGESTRLGNVDVRVSSGKSKNPEGMSGFAERLANARRKYGRL